MTYLPLFSLESTSNLTLIDSAFLCALGAMGMVVPVQGGMGSFHYMIVLGLSLYGIQKPESLPFAVLIHASQQIFAVFLGGLSFILIFLSKKKVSNINS